MKIFSTEKLLSNELLKFYFTFGDNAVSKFDGKSLKNKYVEVITKKDFYDARRFFTIWCDTYSIKNAWGDQFNEDDWKKNSKKNLELYKVLNDSGSWGEYTRIHTHGPHSGLDRDFSKPPSPGAFKKKMEKYQKMSEEDFKKEMTSKWKKSSNAKNPEDNQPLWEYLSEMKEVYGRK